MTPLQTIELRQSELRVELADLAADPEAEQADIETRTAEMRQLEVRRTAALAAQPPDDVETRTTGGDTIEAVVEAAQVAEIVTAALEQRSTTGATKELQDELGMNANQVPLRLLGASPPQVEYRTSGQTPAPSDVGQNQQPIIPAIWPQAAAAWLGVDMPTVGVGEALFPIVSTNLTAGEPAAGADQAHSAGAFTVTTVSPKRVQGSFFVQREDRAKFAGMESALRENLGNAISDQMDKSVVGGFFASKVLADVPGTDAAAEADFATYRALAYSEVDGQYASGVAGVRLLVGAPTYLHMSGKYRGNTADDSVLDSLMRVSGGVRVSSHMPAVASKKASVLVARTLQARHAVAPIWDGPELIVDNVTQAKAGEIVFTLVTLWGGLNVIRKDGYKHRSVQVEA